MKNNFVLFKEGTRIIETPIKSKLRGYGYMWENENVTGQRSIAIGNVNDVKFTKIEKENKEQ